MPYWKKQFNKSRNVYYPQAIVQGKPVETETIAKDFGRKMFAFSRLEMLATAITALL